MAPLPPNEAERLAVLRSLRILGTPPEPHFDAVCRTVAALFSVPIATVTLVDADRQWFKAKCGVSGDGDPREVALCAHTILADEVLVIEDAQADPRFADNPLVTGAPHLRFYAGAPLSLAPGLRLGTLCVIDTRPRRFSEAERRQLQDMASVVVAHLKLYEANAAGAQEAAARHAAILGQLAEGVIVTDGAGSISFVNEAAAAIHGVLRLDVEPDAYSDTYHLYTEDGRLYPPLDLPLARAVRGETVRDARWRILRPDGTEVLAIGSAQPLRDGAGAQVGAVLTLRDDTRREAAERDLRDLNATLAERVAARTREAQAAQAVAEAASRAKSDFLATMSHEIRTPLNGILGYTDLLLEEPGLSEAVRRHGERIQAAGSALLTIVNDILDFSRVEAGRIDLVCEPFALGKLVDEAAAIVRTGAERKGLDLTARVEIDPALHTAGFLGDRDRLRQVLLNLLNNAIKFTPAGGVLLSATAAGDGDGRAWLRFCVQDTGIGVPAAKQHLLFERFSQVDGTIQREYGGTGLGLAISKRLIERMGGRIGVDSCEGRGSTFWFELALPLAARALAAPAASGRATAPACRRLLLVEDKPQNEELALAVLELAGHGVDVAASGAAAIAAVQARAYDLVLMDVQMPGMNGMAATRAIRALAHPSAGLPIVAMTANVLPEEIAAIREAGMQDHIGKPFKRDALHAIVARWALKRPEAASAPRSQLDRGVFDEVAEMMGREQVNRLLGTLAEELQKRLGEEGALPDRALLAYGAHAMVSATGLLGFRELAQLCREVETACVSGADYGALVERLHATRRAAIHEIRRLQAA